MTGTLGYAMADFLDRYMAVSQFTATPPTGGTAWPSTSPAPTDSQPGVMRILAQAALAAAPLAGAYFVPAQHGYAKAALQGMGLGALFHLGGQLLTQYVLAPLSSGSGPLSALQPYYQNEIQASTAETAFLAGVPQGLGRPALRDPGPRAAGVGNCMSPCGAGDMRGQAAAAALSATTGRNLVPVGSPGSCPPNGGAWQGSPGVGPGTNAGANAGSGEHSGSRGNANGSGNGTPIGSGLTPWAPVQAPGSGSTPTMPTRLAGIPSADAWFPDGE